MNQQERVRSLIEIAFVLHRPASGLEPFVETHVRNFARRPKRYREQFLRHCRTAFNRDGFLVIPHGISTVEKPVAIFNEDLARASV